MTTWYIQLYMRGKLTKDQIASLLTDTYTTAHMLHSNDGHDLLQVSLKVESELDWPPAIQDILLGPKRWPGGTGLRELIRRGVLGKPYRMVASTQMVVE